MTSTRQHRRGDPTGGSCGLAGLDKPELSGMPGSPPGLRGWGLARLLRGQALAPTLIPETTQSKNILRYFRGNFRKLNLNMELDDNYRRLSFFFFIANFLKRTNGYEGACPWFSGMLAEAFGGRVIQRRAEGGDEMKPQRQMLTGVKSRL